MMEDSEGIEPTEKEEERNDAGEVENEEPQGTGDTGDDIYSRTSSHDSKHVPETTVAQGKTGGTSTSSPAVGHVSGDLTIYYNGAATPISSPDKGVDINVQETSRQIDDELQKALETSRNCNVSWKKLKKKIKKSGYEFRGTTPDDASSFFHAIIDQLGREEDEMEKDTTYDTDESTDNDTDDEDDDDSKSKKLRRDVVEHLNDQMQHITPHERDGILRRHGSQSWNEYIQKMRDEKTPVDHLVVKATAKVLDREIWIFTNAPKGQETGPIKVNTVDDAAITPLLIAHYKDMHFQSLNQSALDVADKDPGDPDPEITDMLKHDSTMNTVNLPHMDVVRAILQQRGEDFDYIYKHIYNQGQLTQLRLLANSTELDDCLRNVFGQVTGTALAVTGRCLGNQVKLTAPKHVLTDIWLVSEKFPLTLITVALMSTQNITRYNCHLSASLHHLFLGFTDKDIGSVWGVIDRTGLENADHFMSSLQDFKMTCQAYRKPSSYDMDTNRAKAAIKAMIATLVFKADPHPKSNQDVFYCIPREEFFKRFKVLCTPIRGHSSNIELQKALHISRKHTFGTDVLKRNLQQVGYQFRGVTPGDGNCFFHAIVDQLHRVNNDTKVYHSQLRQRALAHLQHNRYHHDGTDQFSFVDGYQSWDDYIQKMKEDGTCVYHLVVMATAEVLGHEIWVFTESPDNEQSGIKFLKIASPGSTGQGPLLIALYKEFHYQSLEQYVPDSRLGDHEHEDINTTEREGHVSNLPKEKFHTRFETEEHFNEDLPNKVESERLVKDSRFPDYHSIIEREETHAHFPKEEFQKKFRRGEHSLEHLPFHVKCLAKGQENVEYVEKETRIVLIGKTGSGKSSTANTLLQMNWFRSMLSSVSITRSTSSKLTNYEGRDVLVIDTPGLFDTEIPNKLMKKEIMKCVALAAPGLHAAVLVTKIGRFTEEEKQNIQEFMKYFGEGLCRYLIIVFTGKDDIDASEMSLKKYLENADKVLKSFVEECNHRYVAVNNRASQEEKREFREGFFALIDNTVRRNGGMCYTNEMLEEAEKLMKKAESKKLFEVEKRDDFKKLRMELEAKLADIRQRSIEENEQKTESLERKKKETQEEMREYKQNAQREARQMAREEMERDDSTLDRFLAAVTKPSTWLKKLMSS